MKKMTGLRYLPLIFSLGLILLVDLVPLAGEGRAQQGTSDRLIEQTRRLLTEAERIRELDFTGELPVELVNSQRIKEIIDRELDEQITPEQDYEYSELYAFLGLMPPGSSLRQAYEQMANEQVAGLYDPGEKKFYVVDVDLGDLLGSMLGDLGVLGNFAEGLLEGLGYDISAAMTNAIIVHELTHAIDDQHFDLERNLERLQEGNSDDEALAYQSLCEGSATRVMNDYAYSSAGADASLLGGLGELNASLAEGLMEYSPFLERIMTAPYFKGESFVRYLLRRGGTDALNRAFRNPPRSMEQVLHPEKYTPDCDTPSIVENPDLSRVLPNWRLEAENTLGELIIGTMFEFALGDPRAGALAAEGWDGDRITTWRAPNNDLAGAWVTVWDSRAEAEEFYLAYIDLLEAKYRRQGTWQRKGSHSALYTGMGRAAALEISEGTVVIAEGVPQELADKCLEAIWSTSVVFQ